MPLSTLKQADNDVGRGELGASTLTLPVFCVMRGCGEARAPGHMKEFDETVEFSIERWHELLRDMAVLEKN